MPRSHLPAVPHTENADELPELSHVYSTHHDDSSCATESQDSAAEAAGSGRGCRHLLVKPWDLVVKCGKVVSRVVHADVV